MFKKILTVLVVVVVLIAVIGFILPRHAVVKRSVIIDRPASLVYATVNSFVLFPKWSPWQDLDPNMHQTTEGPRDGVGAKLVWKGNGKVGSGTQLITASTPNQSVASDLDFGDMGSAKSLVTLTPEGGKTQATWAVDMDMSANPIGHYMGLAMDSMMGKDFASGLGKLKVLVESMPNVEIAGFSAEPVQLTAADGVRVAQGYAGKALKTTHVGAYEKMPQTHEKLRAYMAAHGYTQMGPVFSWYVDDPGTTAAEKLRTEIYVPID
ncbi:MAG: hypothetical protein QOD95_923 [Gammaproteobacteria bacterium]|nr:hypothetical protein [Gammaproteobacteria bacterium]